MPPTIPLGTQRNPATTARMNNRWLAASQRQLGFLTRNQAREQARPATPNSTARMQQRAARMDKLKSRITALTPTSAPPTGFRYW